MRLSVAVLVAAGLLISCFSTASFAMRERPGNLPPPDYAVGRLQHNAPFVILQAGDTTWVQVHTNDTYCPGDPLGGHGGEAEGGPTGSETWCWEQDWPYGDSCGTYAPWDTKCFWHYDIFSLPSQTGINFWHMDTYRTDQRSYCGDSALWCGTDSLWEGKPVECGTWLNQIGYGNRWNCVVELDLPGDFDVVNGCTLYFDPRYDTECKYDYFYVDFHDGTKWQTLAIFNATSNNFAALQCGDPAGLGSPDYWGNTDTNNLLNCNWQQRSDPAWPAFKAEIDAGDYSFTNAPRFRWRFTSDPNWSDMDGRGQTDGAAFVDNVIVLGDVGNTYSQDFESGLDAYWSFPDPDGIMDYWHMIHDPDPPYEGGDGGDRTTCTLDSSVVYRGRPEGGFQPPYRNGWLYRLVTPSMPLVQTGCVIQYDQYMCAKDITCDYTDTRVRFYDGGNETWCPWINLDDLVMTGGCFFWNFDREENITPFYGTSHDSMQFGFDMLDQSGIGDFCRGKHSGTENLIDNVSIGFFDGNASVFTARNMDLLHDSFLDMNICAYNSTFDAYDPDTLNFYDGAVPTRADNQCYVEVTDKDYITSVELVGSINEGGTWVSKAMTQYQPFDPLDPDIGGEYYATFVPSDFGLSIWEPGTEVWYYVLCTDLLSNEEYFPNEADPGDPDHVGGREDYFTFDILPMYPDEYSGVKILLVDGYGRRNYDYSQCFAADDNIEPVEDIYERTLRDAGYCYDKFDILGGGSSLHIHYLCTWNTDYDAVVWFTGPYFDGNLFDKEAQEEMRNYLAVGGKVMLLGDRTAFSATPEIEGGNGEDSLGGEFLSGIMGCDYLSEVQSAFDKPYIYAAGVPSVTVFGTPTALSLGTLAIYRECPYLKDMSWVRTEPTPPGGYVAQPLLTVTNPDVAGAHMGIYVEYQGTGQSVLINYDQTASINHTRQYCSGAAPLGRQSFNPGEYDGRVELFLTVLEDIFGLPSSGTGTGGTTDAPEQQAFRWALHQNIPNPVASGTEVRYEVARASDVKITVYNALGQLVKTLVNEQMEPGRYAASWDARNAQGENVAAGVYFYKMNAGQYVSTKKMLVVK